MHRNTGFLNFNFLTAFSLLLPLLLLPSCKSGKNNIISQHKFVDILVDIHLADGMGIKHTGLASDYVIDSASLYGSVFRKHNVTRAQFDSTMSYYTGNPEDFQKLYNKVIARMKAMDAELVELENNPQTTNEELIWQDSKVHELPQMGYADRVEINVPVRGPGEYTVSAKIRIYNNDRSLNPRMSLYYYYDDKTPEGYRENFQEIFLGRENMDYFQDRYVSRDYREKFYSVSKKLTNPRVTHIKGFIVNHSNSDSLFNKHMVVSEVRVLKKRELKK